MVAFWMSTALHALSSPLVYRVLPSLRMVQHIHKHTTMEARQATVVVGVHGAAHFAPPFAMLRVVNTLAWSNILTPQTHKHSARGSTSDLIVLTAGGLLDFLALEFRRVFRVMILGNLELQILNTKP